MVCALSAPHVLISRTLHPLQLLSNGEFDHAYFERTGSEERSNLAACHRKKRSKADKAR